VQERKTVSRAPFAEDSSNRHHKGAEKVVLGSRVLLSA